MIVVLIAVIVQIAVTGHEQAQVTVTQDEPAPEQGPLIDTFAGTFERDSAGADGWTLTAGAAITEPAHAGTRSLRLVGSESEPAKATSSSVPVVPGRAYGASGYALSKVGQQLLAIDFMSATGAVLTTLSTRTGRAPGAWSRFAVTGTAPPGAANARVTLTSTGTEGNWDDVKLWSTYLPNSSFVLSGSSATIPASWTVDGAAKAWARDARAARGDEWGVALRTSPLDPVSKLSSVPVTVPSGGELDLSGWSRTVSGSASLRIIWLDSQQQPIGSDARQASPSAGWKEITFRSTVPDSADYARVEIASTAGATTESDWDDVSLTPVPPTPPARYDVVLTATNDGYSNTKTSLIVDVSGAPKLCTVLSGAPAQLQLVDLRSGRVEFRRNLPGILNGWALTQSLDKKYIYVGAGTGHVLRLDVKALTLRDIGQATPNATNIFDMVTAPDGRIWGGSYPGGEIWVFDPSTNKFTPAGDVGNGNAYARSLAISGDFLYVGTGPVEADIVKVDTKTPSRKVHIPPPTQIHDGFVTDVKAHGNFISALFPNGSRRLYDIVAAKWLAPSELSATGTLYQFKGPSAAHPSFYFFRDQRLYEATPTAAGLSTRSLATMSPLDVMTATVVRTTVNGIPGDWLMAHDGHRIVRAVDLSPLRKPGPRPDTTPHVVSLPVYLEPVALRIKSMAAAAQDVLIGGYGGSSLALLKHDGKPGALSHLVRGVNTPKYFGEVEGMITSGRYEYFGTYPRSRMFRRDVNEAWDRRRNPVLVADLGESWHQDRPIAWASSAGRVYFGTIPKYGRNGGVLGWFKGSASAPIVVAAPVSQQSVVSLSAHRSIVFGGTSRWGGLGGHPAPGPAEVFAYDSATRTLLWHIAPEASAQSFGAVLFDTSGRLWAATTGRLLQLDPRSGMVLRSLSLGDSPKSVRPTFVETALAELGGKIYLINTGDLLSIEPATLTIDLVTTDNFSPARLTSTGEALYAPSVTKLLKVSRR